MGLGFRTGEKEKEKKKIKKTKNKKRWIYDERVFKKSHLKRVTNESLAFTC